MSSYTASVRATRVFVLSLLFAASAFAACQIQTARDEDAMRSLHLSPKTFDQYKFLVETKRFGNLNWQPDPPLFPGYRPPTRYEAAVGIHAIYVGNRKMQAFRANPIRWAKARIDQQLCSYPLTVLLFEFSKELKDLGVDHLDNIEHEVSAWSQLDNSHNLDYTIAPTIPNSQIYDDLCEIDANGFLAAMMLGNRGSHLPDRYSAAVAVHASLINAVLRLRSPRTGEATRQKLLKLMPPLYRLTDELEPEMKTLGIDVDATRAQILSLDDIAVTPSNASAGIRSGAGNVFILR